MIPKNLFWLRDEHDGANSMWHLREMWTKPYYTSICNKELITPHAAGFPVGYWDYYLMHRKTQQFCRACLERSPNGFLAVCQEAWDGK